MPRYHALLADSFNAVVWVEMLFEPLASGKLKSYLTVSSLKLTSLEENLKVKPSADLCTGMCTGMATAWLCAPLLLCRVLGCGCSFSFLLGLC